VIMSSCIALSTRLTENITMIMGSVFMTVATVIALVAARRIIKIRLRKKMKEKT
jgi:hypothetical protein